MRLPIIEGTIRRRILVNYRVDPAVIQRHLPSRFRPKLYEGRAVAGVCLIRLEHIRPKILPAFIGINSENAAHRIAVLWDDEQGVTREGVFIPRRDTNSEINHLMGGRIFPGEHNKAAFTVQESETEISFSMESRDGEVKVDLAGRISDALPNSSVFPSLSAASSFFEPGSLGYSVTGDAHRLDGIELETKEWRVEPLQLDRVKSSFFADEERFPKGSAEFDHALIMRNIAHEWHSASDLYV
jgi:Uncharacterized conserved protein (COG2071)